VCVCVCVCVCVLIKGLSPFFKMAIKVNYVEFHSHALKSLFYMSVIFNMKKGSFFLP
jgi:hypothetical protein